MSRNPVNALYSPLRIAVDNVDNGILNTFTVITAILKSDIKRKQKQLLGEFNHLKTLGHTALSSNTLIVLHSHGLGEGRRETGGIYVDCVPVLG